MIEAPEFEIVDSQAEDLAEDALCKEICTKADIIDGLIDQFLDVHPAKALAFVTALLDTALKFVEENTDGRTG